MKKLVIATILYTICTVSTYAQKNTGVQFVKGLTWQQILDKAKTENKYIFVDCYATWCGPCKAMDKHVYPQKAVGDTMNSGFICVRLQMDHTAVDNDTVKNAYELAAKVEKDYEVHAYPTFLFFDSEGTAVHKAMGSMILENFLKTVDDAKNSDKQYYSLLKTYQAGKMDYTHMPVLANEAKGMGDEKLAAEVAGNYLHNYLDKFAPQEMLSKQNIAFLRRYKELVKPKDAFFQLCQNEPVKTDSLVHDKSFAQYWIGYVPYKEVLIPMLTISKQNGREPDWDKAKNEIERFRPNYSEVNIIDAKIDWYKFRKDGPNYARYLVSSFIKAVERWDQPPVGLAAWAYNNAAFDVFRYGTDKSGLKIALNWMEQINNAQQEQPNPGMLDTQANLLYKLGRKAEAIKLETKAATLNPDDKDIAATLGKMKAGQATWPDKMN